MTKFKRLEAIGRSDYGVDDSGQVYKWRGDAHRVIAYRWKKVKAVFDTWAERNGRSAYSRVKIGGKSWLVHHLVLIAFVSPRPAGMEARHLDGNTKNNSLGNLQWGTSGDNGKDKVKHGRSLKGRKNPLNAGENNGRAVFTNEEAEKIRSEYIPGIVTYKMLAAKYKCSHWTIMSIIRGWSY